MEELKIEKEIKHLINVEQAWHYKIVPFQFEDNKISFYTTTEIANSGLAMELEILLNRKINFEPVKDEVLEKSLQINYPRSAITAASNKKYAIDPTNDNFLNILLSEAKDLRSSDIHIEKYDNDCRIRFRVDGQLIERHKLKPVEYPILINKIKIAAHCDIAEKRMPQDGRVNFVFESHRIDIRVSILPTLHGEKIVLRLLNNDASHLQISKLGFTDEEQKRYLTAIKKTHGIVLISGPTGSGKTTTLYATLKELNKVTANILTIEDPVEYTLAGINQVQLKEDIGLNYAAALRTFLRQDPDVIMLGEIRDGETAQMAIRASLTGHMVLSTIHTNSAWGTITRLIDMGVPAFLIANTLNLSVAQRLLRTLCPSCKAKETQKPDYAVSGFHLKQISENTDKYKPVGCEHCYYTGYAGRKAIYEVLMIDAELAELIKNNTTFIGDYLKKNNISTLAENAICLYNKGETSFDEVLPYLI